MKLIRISLAALLVYAAPAVTAAIHAASQARDAAPRSSSETQLAAAWSAFAAGRHAEAAKLCDDVLRVSPSLRHDALALKIRVDAARGDLNSAFDSYDRWTSGRKDAALVEPVGERVLQELAGSADAGLRMQAIARLRRAGRSLPPGIQTNDPTTRAASGDAAARDQLLREIASGELAPRRATVEALAEGGASPDQLATLLTNRSPDVRAAAIEALGAARTPGAVGAVAGLRNDPDPYIRLTANVALARAGDPDAQTAAREALSNPVADIRLTAAEAFRPPTPESVAVVRAALGDPDPVIRIKAARMLAPEEAALTVVTTLLSDENPAIRVEAAHTIEDGFPEALNVVRGMLLSSDPWIRLHGAGALLPRAH
jgi:HEAT repeat protein